MAKKYHNTVPVEGKELEARKKRAATQDGKVLAFFDAREGEEFSPCQVWREIGVFNGPRHRHTLLTSIRRSITNLTKAAQLVMTGNTRIGEYNHRVNLWKLA